MVNVYFSDRYENDTLIAVCKETRVIRVINDFINECNQNKDHKFIIYYIRTWTDPENSKKTWYDVGSHSEFFYTIEVEDE